MFINKITAAVAISSTLLVMGCSSSSDSGGGAVSEYNGSWTQACVDDGFDESSITVLDFNGSAVTSTNYEYTDVDCTVPAVPAVITFTGTLVYPGGTTTTALGEARHVDVTGTGISFDGVEATAEQLAESGVITTDYTLILLANDNLYVGEGNGADVNNGLTADTRYVEIGMTDFWIRQ